MPINVTERGVMPPDQTGSQLGQGITTAPALITESAGFQLVDSTNPYTLRFSIPLSLVLIRRARLSFSLSVGVYPAISGSVAGGSTGGTSANHTHAYGNTTGNESGGHSHATASANHDHLLWTSAASSVSLAGANGVPITPGDGLGRGNFLAPAGPTTYTARSDVSGGAGGTSGGESATHNHLSGGTTVGQNVDHTHSIVGGGVTFGAPTSLGRTPSLASAAHIYLATNGGPVVEIKPISTQVQPPYNAPSYNDLDLSAYFAKVPATYELTISSATLGGIMAQMQLTGELNIS